jgi:hypothetical protein
VRTKKRERREKTLRARTQRTRRKKSARAVRTKSVDDGNVRSERERGSCAHSLMLRSQWARHASASARLVINFLTLTHVCSQWTLTRDAEADARLVRTRVRVFTMDADAWRWRWRTDQKNIEKNELDARQTTHRHYISRDSDTLGGHKYYPQGFLIWRFRKKYYFCFPI